jgi:hypothetical protein
MHTIKVTHPELYDYKNGTNVIQAYGGGTSAFSGEAGRYVMVAGPYTWPRYDRCHK